MRSSSFVGRVLLAIVVALFGYFAVQRTLALHLRRTQPANAYAVAGGDARVAAAQAENLVIDIDDVAARKQAGIAARRSLMRDPTSPSAAISLALLAELEGNQKAVARRWADYSLKMSRRELRAHLWSIEDAVDRGDVPLALRHYDMALRTSRAAPELLFPVLSAAIAEAPIRTGVVGILSQQPAWKDLFLNWLSSNSQDLRAARVLFGDLTRRRISIPMTAKASLVGGLVREGAFADAWQVYASYAPGADQRRSRQPVFDHVPEVVSPFDWNLSASEGLHASIQQGQGGAVLTFDADNGAGGVAARQLQLLPPGRYAVRGSGADVYGGPERPYWQLICVDGAELGRVAVGVGTQSFGGVVTVPAGCPVQWLNLYVPLVDLSEPAAGTIERVTISPLDTVAQRRTAS